MPFFIQEFNFTNVSLKYPFFGLPRPDNFKVGKGCEDAVSRGGGLAATIFIKNGKLHVGTEPGELEELCEITNAEKVSRRDFAGVLTRGGWGGTTVAGTVMAASMAKIPIMATGGLGGVHRGAESTMDISADLTEPSFKNIFKILYFYKLHCCYYSPF